MKKIIAIALLAVVAAGIALACVNFDANHYTGYFYRKGEAFDNGFARGYNWIFTGEKKLYSFDQLKSLAEDCRVSLTGILDGGLEGIGITLADDFALVVPGLGLDSGISKTYFLGF